MGDRGVVYGWVKGEPCGWIEGVACGWVEGVACGSRGYVWHVVGRGCGMWE